jgi:hypothetical protein
MKTLLLFHSTHDAINAERALMSAKIACDVIPVPRTISADCGIAIECAPDKSMAARKILDIKKIAYVLHEGSHQGGGAIGQ